jgi:hypothetical protein
MDLIEAEEEHLEKDDNLSNNPTFPTTSSPISESFPS